MPTAKPAETTRFDEALGQNVQGPATRELGTPQRTGLSLVARFLVVAASPEGNLAVLVVDQASVGDRASGQVPGQVFQDVLGVGVLRRGRFDEDHPVAVAQRLQPVAEGGRVLQVRPAVGQLQFAVPVQTRQTGQKLVAKTGTQHAVVDQVRLVLASHPTRLAPNPLLTVLRGPAAGDQGMQVGIMLQVLVPGVQDHQGRRFAAQLLTQHLPQRLPSRVKQQPVRGTPIAQHQRPEIIGQREYNLEIVDVREQQFGGLVQPIRPPTATAQRAVAVEARVVDLATMLTLRALVGVPAQGRGPAERQLGQHLLDLRHGLHAKPIQVGRRVLPQQVDYAEAWAGPLSGGSVGFGFEFVGGSLSPGGFGEAA